MKAIKDTFIFDYFDKSTSLKKKMLGYNPELHDVDISLIEDQLNTIKKRFNYPAKNVILNELGVTIKPVFNKETIKIPSYLPVYIMVNPKSQYANDKVISIVNLTNFATKNSRTNLIDIDERKLFGLLQTGEVYMTCYRKWNSITMSQSICKLGSAIYSRFFIKILDKMFAVNFDPIKADKIKYIASKFFLINLLEKTSGSDIINNMAYANCTNGTSRNTINQFEEDFNNNAYKKLDYLIQQIALEIDGCSTLTIRSFLDTAMKMYGAGVPFAFEYFPMFCHVVFSVVIGARFNNDFVLENVFGREADTFYNEFVNLMR